jgi:chitinase
VADLQAQYQRVIDTLNLTRIDLDVEGSTLNDTAANDRRNQALANLQSYYAARAARSPSTTPCRSTPPAWSPTR